MPDTSFDPRPAHLSGPTRCGSGPEAWAGSGDLPDTKAPAVRTTIVTVPNHWTDMDHGCAVLPVIAREVLATDFYPRCTA